MTLNPQDSALERMEQEDQLSDDAAVDAGASLYESFISPMPKPGNYVPETGLAAARTLGTPLCLNGRRTNPCTALER